MDGNGFAGCFAFAKDLAEQVGANALVAVLREQGDIYDANFVGPAVYVEATNGLVVLFDDVERRGRVIFLIMVMLRLKLGREECPLLGFAPGDLG